MFHSLTPLIQHGTLRVALNLGNHALVQMVGDVPHGMAPALAAQLAQILGVPMRPRGPHAMSLRCIRPMFCVPRTGFFW
ncbi:MAG: hypothetical protein O3B33_04575, partial [Proteobacteria bacterium]|nr:hypothetical protein [Pseudomonadota bacterium]